MFKDCLFSPKGTTKPALEKLIGIAVSLVVHSLLVYAVIHARFTVKIVPFQKEEVRSVMIVPPLKASIPRIVGGRTPPVVPEGLTEEEPSLEGAQAESDRPPDAVPGVTSVSPPPGASRGTPAGEPSGPPGSTAVPSLSSRFRDSLAARRREIGDPRLSILLAPPGSAPGPPGGSAGAVTGPYPDFSKYIDSPLGGGLGGGSGRRSRGAVGGQRVGISIPLKGYDLGPWAGQVVDRIQRFWDLPSASSLPGDAAVRIIVIIKKDGELDAIEILERTSLETFDRAAIQALRASLPFPPLPEDFPGDLLEIRFEFAYSLQ